MAKKRQRKKVYKPPQPKLETQFNCPECGRKKVVEVHFNKRDNKGYLRCRACGEEYESKLKRASEPIDIYYNWINHRDNEDLQAKLVEAKKELFNLRFQNATNQLTNTARIKLVRRDIARIQTVITEKSRVAE